MKKLIIFLILSLGIFAKDTSVTVGESALNKFLTGIGEFSGSGKIDKLIKISYEWKMYDAKINLIENGSEFEAKVDIITEGKVRQGTMVGKAEFSYDKDKQLLNIEVTNLKFRGLDFFNLAGFYRPQYSMPVELFKGEKISIKKNDKETVVLKPIIYEEELKVFEDYILLDANIKFERE